MNTGSEPACKLMSENVVKSIRATVAAKHKKNKRNIDNNKPGNNDSNGNNGGNNVNNRTIICVNHAVSAHAVVALNTWRPVLLLLLLLLLLLVALYL